MPNLFLDPRLKPALIQLGQRGLRSQDSTDTIENHLRPIRFPRPFGPVQGQSVATTDAGR